MGEVHTGNAGDEKEDCKAGKKMSLLSHRAWKTTYTLAFLYIAH